ncbi:DUF5004 domain-containing protein [Arenibacter latericius]|uniref:DUF5004 domain-containing protein n=1 Tax=Arenibacter latericius TaxID=86104 RepID=UPI00041DD280|nr:DUF5004 domain-containing protein [Arenibacter latericius]MDX1364290.1 DUF5004 domain-containing protein [Arenibacter latericius]
MKLRNALMSFGAVALAIGLNSCNLSDDAEFECAEDFTGTLMENENVMLGTWELTGIVADKEVDITEDSENNPKKDIYVQYSDCKKDVDFVFTEDRAYTNSEGQNATDCSNKAKFTGTWKLKETVLSMVSNCFVQTLPLEFNDNKTAFSYEGNYTITDVHGIKIQTNVTFTYTKVANDLQPE